MKVSEQLVMMQRYQNKGTNRPMMITSAGVCTVFVQLWKPHESLREQFDPIDTLRGYGRTGKSSPTSPRHQVPSPHYWKSKCGEDIDSPTRLPHHRKCGDLQRRFIGSSQTGTTSSLVAPQISHRLAGSTRRFAGG
jgi:hypothetical protein